MIRITAETRKARITETELLTSGSAGIQCQFTFTEDWNGLNKMAVFRQGDDGDKYDILLDETNTCLVPWETLTVDGEVLFIGVYGSNAQGIVIIPTVWASAGVVKPGVEPNTPSQATPTPDVWSQILSVAEQAKTTADDAISIAEQAEYDVTHAIEDCSEYATTASNAADDAVAAQGYAEAAQLASETAQAGSEAEALKSEGFALGKQAGDDVDSDSPYYHNNSKYFSEQASASATSAGNAQTAAETAQGKAETAQGKAEDAQAAAEAAQDAIEDMTATASSLAADATATVTKTTVSDVVNLAFGIPVGTTFTPAVDSSGNISWTNDGGKTNPTTRNITGPTGPGVPDAGTTGQYLKKKSNTDQDTEWATADASPTSGSINPVQSGGVYTALGNKVDKVSGKGLSKNDFTDALKTKLEGIEAEANKTVIDTTLATTGQAADAKATGDEISDLKNTLSHKADVIYDTASGDIASFPDGADGLPVKDLTVAIEPVQSGTGDPSPTNVRPISGWTGCNVTRTGKNLLPLTVEGIKAANTSGTWNGNVYSINSATFTIETDTSGNVTGVIANQTLSAGTSFFFAKNCNLKAGTYVLSTSQAYSGGGIWLSTNSPSYSIRLDLETEVSVTLDSDTTIGNVGIYANSGTVFNNFSFKPMIRFSSVSDSAFEPYAGTTLPISWQSSAGTVYGGTLDVTSGVLTVDKVKMNFSSISADNWTYASETKQFYCMPPYLKTASVRTLEIFCSCYKCLHNSEPFSADYNGVIYQGSVYLYVQDQRFTDITIFLNAVGSEEFVYPLATPQSYQLTPQEVTTLLGQNHIWADCGPSTVEYPCDTKLYIQKINAPADDDMIADANIASGQYFIVNNNLYLSTAAILAGDPIKPGTNCTLTNLAAALNALNS